MAIQPEQEDNGMAWMLLGFGITSFMAGYVTRMFIEVYRRERALLKQ